MTYVAERLVFFAALFVPALAGTSTFDLGRLELYITAAALAHSIGPLGTENAMMHQRYSNIVGNWKGAVVVALLGGGAVGFLATIQLDLHAAEIGLVLGSAFAAMHVARNRLRVSASVRPLGISTGLLVAGFGVLLAVSLLMPDATVQLVTFGLILGAILGAIPAFILVRREGERIPTRFRTILRFGAPLSLAAAFSEIVVAADRYVIHYFMGVEAVGTYGVAYRLIMLLSGAASTVVYWWQAEALRKGRGWARAELGSYQRVAGTLVTVGAGVAWFPLTMLISRTLDEPFAIVGAVAAWLLVSIIGFVVLAGYISALISEERTITVGIVTGFNAILNVGLNFALIPSYGLPGAAFATACSQGAAAIAAAIAFHRMAPDITPADEETDRSSSSL